MGLSVSASVTIFFSAFLLFAIILVSSFNENFDQLLEARDMAEEREVERVQTRIEITSAFTDYNGWLIINVSNEAGFPLDPSKVDVIVNGSLYNDTIDRSVDGDSDTHVWAPASVLRLEMTQASLGVGDKIGVITSRGISDYLVLSDFSPPEFGYIVSPLMIDRGRTVIVNTHDDLDPSTDDNLDIQIPVWDNGTGIESVKLYVRNQGDGIYSVFEMSDDGNDPVPIIHDGGFHTNDSVAGDDVYSFHLFPNGTTTESIYFHIVASDGSNVNRTPSFGDYRVIVVDDDIPSILDLTNGPVLTGDRVVFRANVSDNVGVRTVYLDYDYSGLPSSAENMTMFDDGLHGDGNRGDGVFGTYVDVSAFMSDGGSPAAPRTISYRFRAYDHTGNPCYYPSADGGVTTSGTAAIAVTDSILPTVTVDETSPVAYTDDSVYFSVIVSDNIALDSVAPVIVEYTWLSNGTTQQLTMVEDGTGVGRYQATVPLSLSDDTDIAYIYVVNDTAGNSLRYPETGRIGVEVLDVTGPRITNAGTTFDTTTGDLHPMVFTVTEEIGIDSVKVHWKVQGDPGWTVANMSKVAPLSLASGTYSASLRIRPDTTETIHFFIEAVDSGGNIGRYPVTDNVSIIDVFDDDDPILDSINGITFLVAAGPPYSPVFDLNLGTGQMFDVTAKVYDNIGVTEAYIEFNGGGTFAMDKVAEDTFVHSYIAPMDSVSAIEYKIHLYDLDGRINSAPTEFPTDSPLDWFQMNVIDDDLPNIFDDRTDLEGTTGDPLVFSLVVTDNVALAPNEVVVYWKRASDPTFSFNAMSDDGSTNGDVTAGDSVFTYTVPSLSSSDTEPVFYYFTANDTATSQNQGRFPTTGSAVIPVRDDDSPVLVGDSELQTSSGTSPVTAILSNAHAGGTNGILAYRFHITDNKQIVKGVLSINGSGEILLPKQGISSTDTWFNYTLYVPADSLASIPWVATFYDNAGNTISSGGSITVTDTIMPTLTLFTGDSTVTTNESVIIRGKISDNIGIASNGAMMYWKYSDTAAWTQVSFAGGGASIPALSNRSTSQNVNATTIIYYVVLTDTSLNQARYPTTGSYSITIWDNDAPTPRFAVKAGDDILDGTSFKVTLTALDFTTDNVDAASDLTYIWDLDATNGVTFTGQDARTGPNIIHYFPNVVQTYTIALRVTDSTGNSNEFLKTITVDGGDTVSDQNPDISIY